MKKEEIANAELTTKFFDMPPAYQLSIIAASIIASIKIKGFEIQQVETDNSYSFIVFKHKRFTYSICIEEYETVQYEITDIVGVPFSQSELWEHSKNSDFEYHHTFLDLIEKDHWGFIPNMYKDATEFFAKYDNNFLDLSRTLNKHF